MLPRNKPLKRTKGLRRTRIKRQSSDKGKHKRRVDPVRRRFVENATVCEVCERATATDCHEIARGNAKEDCELYPGLWIACCRDCHEDLGDLEQWPVDAQLALRFDRSRRRANLIRGRAPNAISWKDIAVHLPP